MRVDTALLAQDGLDALLDWYEHEFVRIAADPDEPIREMSRRCLPGSPVAGSAVGLAESQ